ncbi:MAG: T9SS type A sorting domain-containing protein [Bacteroidetes bacterium]|nr:T9SS type A sorting domain-containing protein [Bacteroidota bacterium]
MPAFAILAICSVLNCIGLQAQNQYQQWAFGSGASNVNNTNGPLPTNPLISTTESAASWCNNAGNLWFYTNGRDIYNTQIPAGPLNPGLGWFDGNPNNTSAIQGALIVPGYQGAADRFHIFTVSDRGSINTGLVWDCYDATSHTSCGGTSLGFVPNYKGSFTTEGLTAARHANGTDFWVIVKPVIFTPGTPGALIGSSHPTNPVPGGTNSSVYAYLVTANGPSATPVVSNAGFASDFMGGVNLQQEIRCSPDGRLVAITNRISPTSGDIKLYSFDNATGQMQFIQTLPMPSGYSPWSISFSPNSRVFYATGLINASDGEVLRQFDLGNLLCALGTPVPFCDYYTTSPFPETMYSKLQLTPEGRIIRTRKGSDNIDVLNNPNAAGCNFMGYQDNWIDISFSAANAHNSLPNNIDAFNIQQSTSAITEWPKTTTNTNTADKAIAVDVDPFNDVYSAGEFKLNTTFDNLTITGMTGSSTSMYLTKYDNCSGLEWVAKGVPLTPNGTLSTTSMSIGSSLGHVMVTGRYSGQIVFSSAVTPSSTSVCSSSMTINGAGIYIAVYDYNGCLLNVQTIANNPTYTHVSSHITQARVSMPTGSQNRVYVAVNETTTTSDKVQVFAFVVNAAASFSGAWVAPVRSTAIAVVNDIGSFQNTVALTGTFQGNVAWNTSPPFATGASGVNEAFIIGLSDVNSVPSLPNVITQFTKGFEPALNASTSAGTGVAVYSLTDIFLTGTYTNTATNVFGIGPSIPANGPFSSAYAVRINSANSVVNWARYIQSDGYTQGVDVAFNNSNIYLTGLWEGTTFKVQGTIMPTTVPLKLHMYVLNIRLNGVINSVTNWRNHSYTTNDLTDYIRPARIAVNLDYVYVNGAYKGTAQMENDIAANSPLTSTANTFNSFVWRYRTVGGLSLREAETDEPAIETVLTPTPAVFPNPAQHTVNIAFGDESGGIATIEVYNTSGQLIYTETTNSNNSQLGVAEWPAGIYLLRIERNGTVFTEKFIRE